MAMKLDAYHFFEFPQSTDGLPVLFFLNSVAGTETLRDFTLWTGLTSGLQDLKDFARQSGVDVVYSEVSRDREPGGNGKGYIELGHRDIVTDY